MAPYGGSDQKAPQAQDPARAARSRGDESRARSARRRRATTSILRSSRARAARSAPSAQIAASRAARSAARAVRSHSRPRRRRARRTTPVRYPSPIALYTGPFGRAQAERLLWRAGFGPSPGWPEALAAMGVDAAVESLVSPQGPELFTGAEPRTSPTGGPTRARGPLRPRPPVLARSHGSHQPALRAAHGADLARLVRHLQQRGRQPAPDARPVRALRPRRPRLLRAARARGDDGPGHVRVPQHHREPPRRHQRELRARADGAVHARRRPRRLHRDRGARAGPVAVGLDAQLHRRHRLPQLSLRPQPLGHRQQDGLRADGPLQLGGRLSHVRPPPAARVVLRRQALELLRGGSAAGRRGGAPGDLLRPVRPPGHCRWSGRSCATRCSTRGRA